MPRARRIWRPPRSERYAPQGTLEGRPFGAPVDTVSRGLEQLSQHRRELPTQTFVFVLSDFLVLPDEGAWLRALEHQWEVVPVIVQDPVWERSFPDVGGLTVPYADPASGGVVPVYLTRAEAGAPARRARDAPCRALARVPHARDRAGADRLARSGSDPRRVPALGRSPDDGAGCGRVKRAVRHRRASRSRTRRPGGRRTPFGHKAAIGGKQPIRVYASVDPPVHLFGDADHREADGRRGHEVGEPGTTPGDRRLRPVQRAKPPDRGSNRGRPLPAEDVDVVASLPHRPVRPGRAAERPSSTSSVSGLRTSNTALRTASSSTRPTLASRRSRCSPSSAREWWQASWRTSAIDWQSPARAGRCRSLPPLPRSRVLGRDRTCRRPRQPPGSPSPVAGHFDSGRPRRLRTGVCRPRISSARSPLFFWAKCTRRRDAPAQGVGAGRGRAAARRPRPLGSRARARVVAARRLRARRSRRSRSGPACPPTTRMGRASEGNDVQATRLHDTRRPPQTRARRRADDGRSRRAAARTRGLPSPAPCTSRAPPAPVARLSCLVARSTGEIVIDMSASDVGQSFRRIATVIGGLSAANQAMGLDHVLRHRVRAPAAELARERATRSSMRFFTPQTLIHGAPDLRAEPVEPVQRRDQDLERTAGRPGRPSAGARHARLACSCSATSTTPRATWDPLVAEALALRKAHVPIRIVPLYAAPRTTCASSPRSSAGTPSSCRRRSGPLDSARGAVRAAPCPGRCSASASSSSRSSRRTSSSTPACDRSRRHDRAAPLGAARRGARPPRPCRGVRVPRRGRSRVAADIHARRHPLPRVATRAPDLWRSPPTIPGDPARTVLGVDDALAYRHALQLFWLTEVGVTEAGSENLSQTQVDTQQDLQALVDARQDRRGALRCGQPARRDDDQDAQRRTARRRSRRSVRATSYFRQAVERGSDELAREGQPRARTEADAPRQVALRERRARRIRLRRISGRGSHRRRLLTDISFLTPLAALFALTARDPARRFRAHGETHRSAPSVLLARDAEASRPRGRGGRARRPARARRGRRRAAGRRAPAVDHRATRRPGVHRLRHLAVDERAGRPELAHAARAGEARGQAGDPAAGRYPGRNRDDDRPRPAGC